MPDTQCWTSDKTVSRETFVKYKPTLANIREGRPFYVVAVCFVVDSTTEKCLLLRRADTQMIHPGLWAPIGGKLEWSDLTAHSPSRENGTIDDWEHIVEILLRREAMEEANIQVGDFKYIDSVGYIRPDGMPSICLKFAGRYLGGAVEFPADFSECNWFDMNELAGINAIQGASEEGRRAIGLMATLE